MKRPSDSGAVLGLPSPAKRARGEWRIDLPAASDPRALAPVRLQLSRRKGFNLQAWSRGLNGRDAVKVDRTTMWGNRWKVGVQSNRLGRPIATVAEAVDAYRALAWPESHHRAWVAENLRGKNLACWCALDAPCHADVLLELANL